MKTKDYFFKILLLPIILLICSSSIDAPTHDPNWGFYGHKRINRMAVFTLPPEMIGFFKKNIEYVTAHAVDPDKRRYATKHEGVRHYIDIDHWGENPLEEVPRYLSEAVMKYGEMLLFTADGDTLHLFKYVKPEKEDGKEELEEEKDEKEEGIVEEEELIIERPYSDFADGLLIVKKDAQTIFGQDSTIIELSALKKFYEEHISKLYFEDEWKIDSTAINEFLSEYGAKTIFKEAQMIDHFSEYGIIPYHLLTMKNKLTKAFETGDKSRILRTAAEIGHYIGDAHVPLHTTENYNGQMTGQDGIHGFWESRLPELFADETYNFWVGKAKYIEKPREYFWDVIAESHSYVDTILSLEKQLSLTFPSDKQYCYEMRLERTIRTQCKAYATEFHKQLDGMVEKRMTDSILSIGSVWFSAWVDAGQPSLDKMDKYTISEEEKKKLEEEEKMFRQGEIKGRKHSN